MTSPAMQRAMARQAGQAKPDRDTSESIRVERWPCVCAFAKDCNETSPYAFPRVGFYDTILYRGGYIIQHKSSGRRAYEPPVKECCHRWFAISEEA